MSIGIDHAILALNEAIAADSSMLTVANIEARVEALHKLDDECAHSEEDSIRQDVLRAIAEGKCEDPAACASAALKSEEIDFCRWYA